MAIAGKCPSCGKKIKAPDSAAGRRAKCPQCGKTIKIPEAVYDAEEVAEDDFGADEDYDDDSGVSEESETYGLNGVDEYDAPAIEQRRPCSMCGEMIVATAAKCRFCGEIFDETLKRKKKRRARQDRDYYDGDLSVADWLICIFCSGIGCIVGIVAMCRGDSSRGGKMIGISLIFGVIWNIINVLIQDL